MQKIERDTLMIGLVSLDLSSNSQCWNNVNVIRSKAKFRLVTYGLAVLTGERWQYTLSLYMLYLVEQATASHSIL